MPTDYLAITSENEDMLGKDTESRRSQVLMYSDFTHFIYEILQNADDYEATEIWFRLLRDRLIIEHNGIPFKPENVKAISYFGKSTSREDLVKTGHFGLGFKSVFAFTATPFVFSGDECFEIHGLYRLRPASPPDDLPAGHTRIILPFNHVDVRPDYIEEYVTAENAYEKILKRLKKLDPMSLLFTRKLRDINWEADSESSEYSRVDTEVCEYSPLFRRRKTTITDSTEFHGYNAHRYYVFSRPLSWRERQEDIENEHRPVEIAFKLGLSGIHNQRKIPLFVLFRTKIETNMGFILNGPYRTTPNRETVKEEDAFNQHLVRTTAALLTDALPRLKEMGLVTVSLLQALPIRPDDFNEENMFRPIYDAVQESLLHQPLIPTSDSGFVSAKHAKLARGADLRKLFNKTQLGDFFSSDSPMNWISGEITQDRTPDLLIYLKKMLRVEEMVPESVARKLTVPFLEKQPDLWIAELYAFLNTEPDLWEKPNSVLRKKEFLRLEDGSHVRPFQEDGRVSAYLPGSSQTRFPTIKNQIADYPPARRFLQNLRLIEPDSFYEVIDFVFPKYSFSDPIVSKEENIQDLRLIKKTIDALPQDQRTDLEAKLCRMLAMKKHEEKAHEILACVSDNNFIISLLETLIGSFTKFLCFNQHIKGISYMLPKELYVFSSPLGMYFSGNQDVWFVDDQYPPDIIQLSIKLGCAKIPRVQCGKNEQGHIVLKSWHRFHERGLDGFDPNCTVDGLDHALSNSSVEKAAFIWNEIAIPNIQHIRGIVESSSRKDYLKSKKEKCFSKIGKLLFESKWLPGKDGQFHTPKDLYLADLPEEFKRVEMLSTKLEMKSDVEEAYLSKLSEEVQERIRLSKLVPIEVLRKYAQEAPDERETDDFTVYAGEELDYSDEFKKSFVRPGYTTSQEERSTPGHIHDPERYKERLQESIQEAKHNEPAVEARFRRVPRKVWEGKCDDTRVFLEEQYGGKCQICDSAFVKRDGGPYFEGLYIVHRTRARWIDHRGNVLCLCPTCSAKFQHGSVEAGDNLDKILQSGGLSQEREDEISIDLSLCGEGCKIRFSERHFLALQALLKSSGLESDD